MKHLEKLSGSNQFLKVLLIGFIIVLLQIPITMLHVIISERQENRDTAVADVTSKWGHDQALMAPVLVVPYREEVKEYSAAVDGKAVRKDKPEYVTRYAVFLPDALDVSAEIESQPLYRGIYEVPVYNSKVEIKGHFKPRDFSGWEVAQEDILWHRASLNFLISDARALTSASDVSWGADKLKLEPGAHFGDGSGVHARLTKEQASLATREFSLNLDLKGSGRLYVAPVGSQTNIKMVSDWPDPSFQGNWLPVERKVNEGGVKGFEANWAVNLLGRNYPRRWQGLRDHWEDLEQSYMGVWFMAPVDQYRMAFRSVKYDVLFLTLVFMTLWLFEVLSGVRIHAIQYVFVGAAMCLFYLLELSLSEQIGFLWAYCIASAMVCGLVAGYCRAVLKTSGRAIVVSGVLSLLYAYLYMLLVNQDYALLAGSVGLFMVLAAVMYLTRNVDWHGATSVPLSPG